MFALTTGQDGAGGAVQAARRFVLPRWLRKPARIMSRLDERLQDLPPFTAAAASALLFAATGVYGAIVGGHGPGLLEGFTARSGFAITEVRVTGNRETSEIDVLGQIGLNGFTSLIGFNAGEARARLAALPWVEEVTVRKVYPGAIEVEIAERSAFAVWQHDNELTVIEKDGRPIAPLSDERHARLPLVVGAGAPEKAAAFIQKVSRYPEIASRVVGYVRVADRRWDLRLGDGVTVRLPEAHENAALAELAEMDRSQRLLSKDIVAVDLRADDRIAIQLAPDAAAARAEEMKALLKGRKGRRI